MKLNKSIAALPAGYLFAEVAKRVNTFIAANPDKPVLRLGIGDVTRPLVPAVTDAFANAARAMGTKEGFHGYGPDFGYQFLLSAIAKNDYQQKGVMIEEDEIFLSDGAKTDCGALQELFAADATIAVRQVPWEEASRFGIMNTDEDFNIVEFEEKPKNPKSNNASMGVYVFTWEKLRKYLIQDEADPTSSNDFGKNIIPAMLNDGQKMVAYSFNDYWKDVGTIESLWEANMDLLAEKPEIDLHDKKFRIYARNLGMPPHHIADGAVVENCLITEGCEIMGKTVHSILSSGVIVEEGAEVIDSVIMPGAIIRKGAVVRRAIVAENAEILGGCRVGEEEGLIAVVGQSVTVPENTVVKAGEQFADA